MEYEGKSFSAQNYRIQSHTVTIRAVPLPPLPHRTCSRLAKDSLKELIKEHKGPACCFSEYSARLFHGH